jgi:hypothetical protein
MENEKYLRDLKEIRKMMNRSSRFISLSGFSGISVGIIALAGTYLAYRMVYLKQGSPGYHPVELSDRSLTLLLVIALSTILLSFLSGIFFTTWETRKKNQKIWDGQTRRLLINFLIPLIAGGIICPMLLYRGFLGIVAPLTLVFYGLALLTASKYTLNEIRSLGLLEIALGLLAMQFISYGLLFWSLGFGLLHIIYGAVVYLKYRS